MKTDVTEALGIKRLNVLEKRNDYELKKLYIKDSKTVFLFTEFIQILKFQIRGLKTKVV